MAKKKIKRGKATILKRSRIRRARDIILPYSETGRKVLMPQYTKDVIVERQYAGKGKWEGPPRTSAKEKETTEDIIRSVAKYPTSNYRKILNRTTKTLRPFSKLIRTTKESVGIGDDLKGKVASMVITIIIGLFVALAIGFTYIGTAIILYAFYKSPMFPSEMDVVGKAYEKIAAQKSITQLQKMELELGREINKYENSYALAGGRGANADVLFQIENIIDRNKEQLKAVRKELKEAKKKAKKIFNVKGI